MFYWRRRARGATQSKLLTPTEIRPPGRSTDHRRTIYVYNLTYHTDPNRQAPHYDLAHLTSRHERPIVNQQSQPRPVYPLRQGPLGNSQVRRPPYLWDLPRLRRAPRD